MAEQNSYDFWTRYSNLCLKCKVCPLKSVIKHMRGTMLCCPVERIRSEHWQFLLSALSVDNSLTEVCFKSDLPTLAEQEELWKKRRRKKDESYPCPYGYSNQNISDICKYSSRLLTVSQTLQVLIIENLPITNEDALHLAEGLKSTLLKEFALRCYPYCDKVIEIVCRGLWDSDVFLIDFSSCNMSLEGLESIRNVILTHKARRTIQAFPDTLRYRVPVFEEMSGLTRIILNGNNIGDKGVYMICEAVSDDRWIHALDLQCCGITNEGAEAICNQIVINHSMQVVDLRLNEIDVPILERISMQLGVNCYGKTINYTYLPLWKPRSFSKAIAARKNKLKTKVTKKYSVTKKVIRKETKGLEHAFRISCEIVEDKDLSTKDAIVQTDIINETKYLKDRNKNLELTVLKEISTRDSLMELSEKFKSENLKLRHLNETLRRENMNLRQEVMRSSSSDSAILIDNETYSEIKHVFEKFQMFFKLMKDKGLWDLVSKIGVAEYENTRLKAVPSESKVCFVEKVDSPPDGCPSNGPSLKQQRNCTCHSPGCISNQKAEKEYNAFNVNRTQKVTEERVQHTDLVGCSDEQLIKHNMRAKVNKVFKELRETYTKSVPATKPLSLKCVLNREPNKFKQIKNRQDLYEAVKSEMERIECACQLHKASQSPDKGSQSVKNQTKVNNQGYFKNVSSQTAAVESLSKFKCQKINPVTSTGSVSSGFSQKSGHQSNSSSSTIKPSPPPGSLKRALSVVSREWDEHVKKNFPDCNIESRGIAAGAEGSNSILVDPEYFKTWASHVEYTPRDVVPDFNEKEPVPLQGSPKSTSSKNVNSFSSNSVGNHTGEQKNKVKSNQTNSSKDTSNKSYLESVSDASTDKDVKSLSGSELYESVKSDSVNSKSSNKSGAQKTVSKFGSNPGVKNSALSNSSSKSSKRSQKQKKNSNQNASGGGKILKENVSSSSVPSLSDITSVSSHSLNTDSVLDQLSESEKGLS